MLTKSLAEDVDDGKQKMLFVMHYESNPTPSVLLGVMLVLMCHHRDWCCDGTDSQSG